MDILGKFFQSEQVTVKRSEIHPSAYNPRKITPEGYKALKRSIKTYGVVGGIVVNRQTGNTIVGGHQKVAVLDELNKYTEDDPETDYELKVEMIDVEERTEKSLNVALNNPNVGGYWDNDRLRELIPDIDYKDAGLTDADLSMIGVEFLFQGEEERAAQDELTAMMADVDAEHRAEVEQRAVERKAVREAEKAMRQQEEEAQAPTEPPVDAAEAEAADWQGRVEHMMGVKKKLKEDVTGRVNDADAYMMLSFSDFAAKKDFCEKYGYDPYLKFVKGEEFDRRIEEGMGMAEA